jgi:hypothetical protein
MQNGTQEVPTVSTDEQPEGDSAEESRAAGMAIRKRQRVDPFESGGKKKKKRKVVELVGTTETARTIMDDVEMKDAPQSQSGLMTTDDMTTKSSPKKKKKKKHRLESQGAQGHDTLVNETRSADLDADITRLSESSTRSLLLEEWDGIVQDQEGSRSGTPGSSSPGACSFSSVFLVLIATISIILVPSPRVGALPSSLSTSTQPPSAASTSSFPILNLTGAPPIAPEPSSPKKRKRRRKKKKSTPGQGPDYVPS